MTLSKINNKNEFDPNFNMYQKEERELESLIEEFSKVKKFFFIFQ